MRFAGSIMMSMAMLTFWTVSALAVDKTKEGDKGKRTVISINMSMEQVERADIDGTAASMEYTEFSAGLEWRFLFFDIDHRIYDWQNSEILGIVDPFEGLTRIATGVQYYQEFADKWAVWIKGAVIAGFEDDLASESLTYNPQVVTFYLPTRQISLFCGVGMLYHPVDQIVYPVVGVTWNMDSKKGLSGALGFPETILRYGLNEKTALKFDFQSDNRMYQLAQDNKSASEGYIQVENFTSGLHLEYEPLKGLILSGGVRRYFGRNLKIFDHEEQELTSNEVSESWAYLLGVNYKF